MTILAFVALAASQQDEPALERIRNAFGSPPAVYRDLSVARGVHWEGRSVRGREGGEPFRLEIRACAWLDESALAEHYAGPYVIELRKADGEAFSASFRDPIDRRTGGVFRTFGTYFPFTPEGYREWSAAREVRVRIRPDWDEIRARRIRELTPQSVRIADGQELQVELFEGHDHAFRASTDPRRGTFEIKCESQGLSGEGEAASVSFLHESGGVIGYGPHPTPGTQALRMIVLEGVEPASGWSLGAWATTDGAEGFSLSVRREGQPPPSEGEFRMWSFAVPYLERIVDDVGPVPVP